MISVIIPVYNEATRVGLVIDNCKKYFDNILIIDDGSTDLTLKESIDSKADFILRHCINCGQGTAIRTGIRFFLTKTNFDYLITIDGDNQHYPDDAFSILSYAIKINADAVFGSRLINTEVRKGLPRSRLILLWFANLFERTFYATKLTDAHNGLRVLSRKA